MRIVTREERHDAEQRGHVVLGILFFYRFDLLRDRDIPNLDGIEQTEPFAETHEIIHGIQPPTDLQNDILRALIVADDEAVTGVMAVESNEFIEHVGILCLVIELRTERADLIDEAHRARDQLFLQGQMLLGQYQRVFLFGDPHGN